MNLVYIHVGDIPVEYNGSRYNPRDKSYTSSDVPSYMWGSIYQSRKHYKDKIFVVLPKSKITPECEYKSRVYDCTLIPVEDFFSDSKTSFALQFLKLRLSCSDANITDQHFLCVTFIRMFILCELIRNYQLKHVWHLENDNIIFDSLPVMDKISYCNVSDHEASAGIMYIPDSYHSTYLAEKMLQIYKHNRDKSEMYILKQIGDTDDKVEYLDKYRYDGASYGQYLEGTAQNHGTGHISPHHYAAKDITKLGLKYINSKPHIGEHPLVNLHIHNKSRVNDIVYNSLDNVTLGVMSAPHMHERYTACRSTWMNKFTNKFIFVGRDHAQDSTVVSLPCTDDYISALPKQFLGLKYMYEKSKTDWYLFTGCDTFVYSDKLAKLLSQYNPNENIYLGCKQHCGDFRSLYRLETPCKYWVSGGPGIILSKKIVETIYPRLQEFEGYWRRNKPEFNAQTHDGASDVALAYILWKEYNIFATVIDEPILLHSQPVEYMNIHPDTVSFHYIEPEKMLHMWNNY